MSKRYLYYLIAFLFISSVSNAQDYAFKVLANRGQNQVKNEGGEIVPLKSGVRLLKTEELIASDGVYLGLMHHSGKTLEIKEPGNYKIADLIIQVNGKELSSISKYAQYVSNKLTSGEKEIKNKQPGSRSVGDKITLMLAESVNVYNSEALIRWKTTEQTNEPITYQLFVKDILEEVLYVKETTGTSVMLNFDEIESDMGLYILSVVKKGDESFASANHPVKSVNEEDFPNIENDLKALSSDMTDNSPLQLIMLASFYEDNNLFLDALTMYEEALALAPDIKEYQDLYKYFLMSYGLQ